MVIARRSPRAPRLTPCYEMADLEKAVAGDDSKRELLDYASDVMELMTKLRADWGVVYPEEE